VLNTVSRFALALELIALALLMPGAVLGFVAFSGAPSSFWSIALSAAFFSAVLTWAAVYFQALGYIRSGDSGEAGIFDWVRLIGLVGSLPAAAVALFLSAHPPRHVGPLDGLPLAACLIWIPAAHLELVRAYRRRSNNAWSGRDA